MLKKAAALHKHDHILFFNILEVEEFSDFKFVMLSLAGYKSSILPFFTEILISYAEKLISSLILWNVQLSYPTNPLSC